MFLEEAIKKTTERMEAFRHRAMVALGKEFQIDESDKEREREMVAQEVGDEAVKRLGRIWEIDPSEIMNAEHRIVYEGSWRRPSPSPYIYRGNGDVWIDGGAIASVSNDPTTKPQEFELTNELYHLIIDCTETILDYCRANNRQPNYRINTERPSGFIAIDIGHSGYRLHIDIGHSGYRLQDKSGLPGLEEFLRRVYE